MMIRDDDEWNYTKTTVPKSSNICRGTVCQKIEIELEHKKPTYNDNVRNRISYYSVQFPPHLSLSLSLSDDDDIVDFDI